MYGGMAGQELYNEVYTLDTGTVISQPQALHCQTHWHGKDWKPKALLQLQGLVTQHVLLVTPCMFKVVWQLHLLAQLPSMMSSFSTSVPWLVFVQ